MAGAHHRHNAAALCLPDLLGHVDVPLVDQYPFGLGQGLAQLGHQPGHDILPAHGGQLVLVQLGFFKERGDERGQQVALFEPWRVVPGPAQGDAHVAVAEHQGNVQGFGALRGLQELFSGRHAGLVAQPLLVGGENQVGQKGAELFAANELLQIQLLPGLAVGQCLIAVLIELDADTVRPLCGNDLLDQFPGLSGQMGRADQ